jgi:uncharacterized protein
MEKNTSSRRKFIKNTIIAGGAGLLGTKTLLAASSSYFSSPAPTLRGKKALFVYGGWAGHDPEPSRDLFVPWMREEGADVTVSDTLDAYLDNELMSSLDLIVQIWTMGEITKDQQSGLLTAIRNGCGIAGWHGGLGDSFRNNVEFQFMAGGQWVSHPGGIINYRVNIIDQDDYVTANMEDFAMHSEQYYMHVDPNVKVLATTTFSDEHAYWIGGAVMPQVWKKYYGDGRVFYSALGHVIGDFQGYEVFEIQKRGIRWAAESKYHPREKWLSPVYRQSSR